MVKMNFVFKHKITLVKMIFPLKQGFKQVI